jgi:Tol biopolymer transport system component
VTGRSIGQTPAGLIELHRPLVAALIAIAVMVALALGACVLPQTSLATTPVGQIAFLKDESIWIMDADGGGQRELWSDTRGRMVQSLTWSPDGSRLAFIAFDYSGSDEIRIIDLSGETKLVVPMAALGAGASHIESVAWSPDGQSIAYGVDLNPDESGFGYAQLGVFGIESGETVDYWSPGVEPGSGTVGYLRWYPDGHHLICLSKPGLAGAFPLRLLEVDAAPGGQARELAEFEQEGGYEYVSSAAWSPDGSLFAMSRLIRGDDFATPPTGSWSSLVVARQDGSGRRELLRSPPSPWFELAYWLGTVSWSPDGRYIAYERGHDNVSAIAVIPATGGAERILVSNATDPAWRPITPPPTPTLRVADADLVEGDSLHVSGAVKKDGLGSISKVIVFAGSQRWELRLDGKGHYDAKLRSVPGDYRLYAVAVRQGLQGKRSPEKLVRLRSTSAALFGFTGDRLGPLDSAAPVSAWAAPLKDAGWKAAARPDATAAAALRLMTGKGLVIFDGHGLVVRAPGARALRPGFALAFAGSRLTTTRALAAAAARAAPGSWQRLDSADLSALQVAVYAGYGTGEHSDATGSLLRYATDSGADAALGFSGRSCALAAAAPWLAAFRTRALTDGLDVRTAALRAEQDCALFDPLVVVRQRDGGKVVFIDEAPALVHAGGSRAPAMSAPQGSK